jgi:hypothetical protein
MADPPFLQEAKQILPRDEVRVFSQVACSLSNLVVQGFVLREAGIAMLLHDLFFVLEVNKRVLKQSVQDMPHGVAIVAFLPGFIQLVDDGDDLLSAGRPATGRPQSKSLSK